MTKESEEKSTNIDVDNYRKTLLARPEIEYKLLTHRSASWPPHHTAFPRDSFLLSKCIFHKYEDRNVLWNCHQNLILSTVTSLLCLYTVYNNAPQQSPQTARCYLISSLMLNILYLTKVKLSELGYENLSSISNWNFARFFILLGITKMPND